MVNKSSSGKKKVLIIEDDELLVRICSAKLQQEGIEVLSAGDGEAGLAKTIYDKPDLILLDLMLPDKDGFWYLEEVSKKPELRKIPILTFSNLAQQTDIDRAKNLGAREYFVKINSTISEVVKTVKKQLG